MLLRRLWFCGAVSICLSLVIYACRKEKHFPAEPVISLKSFSRVPSKSGKDSLGILTLRFTDGDGDVGLGPSDTLPPFNPGSLYYFNFFVTYLEKQNGEFIKIASPGFPQPEDTLTNNGRIPDLRFLSNNKGIEGEIAMKLFINNPFSSNDTVKYMVSICDRSLKRSNTVSTPEIVLIK